MRFKREITAALSALLLTSGYGCVSSNPSSPLPPGEAVPTCNQIKVPLGFRWNVPVVYLFPNLVPLTTQEQYYAHSQLLSAIPDSWIPWFAVVDRDYQGMDANPRHLTTFFKPTISLGRLRKGFFAGYNLEHHGLPPTYTQVLPRDHATDRTLEVPTIATLPFWVDPRISDETTLEVVDMVRPLLRRDDGVIFAVSGDDTNCRVETCRAYLSGAEHTAFAFERVNGVLRLTDKGGHVH